MANPDRSSQKRRVKVYPALREMCLNYTFWPRQPLHIEELASVLASSTTPVREALARLAGEGLIDVVPNRGYAAKVLCEEEMHGSLELLFMLLKNCIARRKSLWIAADDALRDADGQETTHLIFRVERTFAGIADMSDNDMICRQVARLIENTRFVRKLDLEDPAVATTVHKSHEELQGSLSAGDQAAAVQHLDQQNRGIQQRLACIVKEGQARSMSRLQRVGSRDGGANRSINNWKRTAHLGEA